AGTRGAQSNQGSSRASGRGSEKQGIGLRIHYFYSSTNAPWDCRIAYRSDLVRDHVGDSSNSECSRLDDSDRLLSPVDSAKRERPSLCYSGESADGCMGFDCHCSRLVCQFGRKSDRSGQHSGLDILCSILGLFLAAFFIRGVTGSAVFFAALIAQALVFVLFATTSIGYLWYNFIGCAAVLILAPVLQQTIFRGTQTPAGI